MKFSRRLFVAALAAPLLTSACVVGPDFHRPAPPPVSSYTATPQRTIVATRAVPGGEGQHFVSGAEIPAEWWTLFHSKALNALIEQALANNADLKAAQAAILVAHESTRAQRGALFLSTTALPT
jgi:outer membrane protein TolC